MPSQYTLDGYTDTVFCMVTRRDRRLLWTGFLKTGRADAENPKRQERRGLSGATRGVRTDAGCQNRRRLSELFSQCKVTGFHILSVSVSSGKSNRSCVGEEDRSRDCGCWKGDKSRLYLTSASLNVGLSLNFQLPSRATREAVSLHFSHLSPHKSSQQEPNQ
jgi:hypothetical protein